MSMKSYSKAMQKYLKSVCIPLFFLVFHVTYLKVNKALSILHEVGAKKNNVIRRKRGIDHRRVRIQQNANELIHHLREIQFQTSVRTWKKA